MNQALHPAHARLISQFGYQHLPEHLQAVSRPFYVLAFEVVERAANGDADGADTTVALRKLLEAKDAAVRALL